LLILSQIIRLYKSINPLFMMQHAFSLEVRIPYSSKINISNSE